MNDDIQTIRKYFNWAGQPVDFMTDGEVREYLDRSLVGSIVRLKMEADELLLRIIKEILHGGVDDD